MTPRLDPAVIDVLARTTVVEFTTTGRRGGPNTRPMTSVWLDDQIVLTTPIAYPQKADNVRRDPRVAILYSDFTGSGLVDPQPVLVQGTATAPDLVAGPQDLRDYWRRLVERNPGIADQAASPDHRRDMDWYYWRLPIVVRPDAVHVMARSAAGGASEPEPPIDQPMSARIADALRRYPTAVFATHDPDGRPWSARTDVVDGATAGALTLHPTQEVRGMPGPADLLWHRYGGSSGVMSDLLVRGTAEPDGDTWTFTPTAVAPTLDASSYEDWIADGRARSLRNLQRRELRAPDIDWGVLARPAQHGSTR